jgi:UDP-N-acetylmuramate--alanine ligase
MRHQPQTYYFIGIGGVGMSALARLCLLQEKTVLGYDRVQSRITDELEEEGIPILFNDSVEALFDSVFQNETQIIFTAAIPDSHPQLSYFIENGFNVKKRALFMAELCANKPTLAVAGTHGKTTTTAFLTHIFSKTGQSFTSIMGGFFQNDSSNLISTGDDFMLVEADEYDRSFLHLHPTISGITSIDSDHLDVYETREAFENAFAQFSSQVSQQRIVAHGVPLEGLTYGIDVPADYRIHNVKTLVNGYEFDLTTPSEEFSKIRLNQLGEHNLSNMLCALAMADQVNVSMKAALDSMVSFPGVHRRMHLFQWDNKWLIDDYAHHPTEIRSVLKTLKTFYPNEQKCVIFQPHLFSRTQDFYQEFLKVLTGFDEVILLDIYPAREKPIAGVTSSKMVDDLMHSNKKLIKKDEISEAIMGSQATVFALLGAGDIGEEIQQLKLKSKLNEKA